MSEIGIDEINLQTIAKIYQWKSRYFETVRGGGKYVGKITVNQILQRKELTGCHDHGLLISSILRHFGCPSRMVDATGIDFSLKYPNTQGFSGHVFVEAYIDNKWVLLNSTSPEYINNYDPYNPIIPITNFMETVGYYTMRKGVDPSGYGINDISALTNLQKSYARKLKKLDLIYPQYEIIKIY